MFGPVRDWGHDGWVLNAQRAPFFDPKVCDAAAGLDAPATTSPILPPHHVTSRAFPLEFHLASLWPQSFSDGDNMEAEAMAL